MTPHETQDSKDPKAGADSHGEERSAYTTGGDPEQLAGARRRMQLEASYAHAVGWFRGIAGLSLLNTALIHGGAGIIFIGSLGTCRVIDYIAAYAAVQGVGVAIPLAVALNLMAAAVFFGLGWVADGRKRWPFVVGMLLYLLDGGVCVWMGDWLEVAFHAWVFHHLFRGWRVLGELQEG